MNRKKIVIGAVFFAFFLIVVFLFLKNGKQEYSLFEAKKGEIREVLFESGTVKTGQEISLSFLSFGKIEKINIQKGDFVEKGQILAEMENLETALNLEKAKQSLKKLQIEYSQLLSGTDPEKAALGIADSLELSRLNYESAQKEFQEAQAKAENDLRAVYNNSLNSVLLAVDSAYSALVFTTSLQSKYFGFSNYESEKLINAKALAVESLLGYKNGGSLSNVFITELSGGAKGDVQKALSSKSFQDVETAIESSIDATKDILAMLQSLAVNFTFTETETLSGYKTTINQQLSALNLAKNNISAQKILNDNILSSLERKKEIAKTNFEIGLKNNQASVEIYQARIKQAEIDVDLLKNQLSKLKIVAPQDGIILDFLKKPKETVQMGESIVIFAPKSPWQVEAEIYEADIGRIKIGDPVEIKLIAFQGKTLKGEVVFKNPNQKKIDGVIYYSVIIDLENSDLEIQSGMSADVSIISRAKEDVLIIPESAIKREGEKKIVQVSAGKKLEEREIETGIRGEGGTIEVVVGLSENELVAVKK